MLYNAKLSLTTWWLVAIVSLFVWYRNEYLDRYLAIYLFLLAFIQLLEYGYMSGSKKEQTNKMIFCLLWLQLLVLSIGSYLYTKSAESIITLTISFIFVIASIFCTYFSKCVVTDENFLFHYNGYPMISFYVLYAFLTLVTLLTFKKGLIYFIYGILASILLGTIYSPGLVCYLIAAFSFLVWLYPACVIQAYWSIVVVRCKCRSPHHSCPG